MSSVTTAMLVDMVGEAGGLELAVLVGGAVLRVLLGGVARLSCGCGLVCDITAHTVILYVLFCLIYMYCTLYVLYILHTVHIEHVPCFRC